MGRGRGKGKKLTAVPNHEDGESGGEELLPAFKRRGRLQKASEEALDKEGTNKVEEEEGKNPKDALDNEVKIPAGADSAIKRKRYSQVKEKVDFAKEENVAGSRSSNGELVKSNGFRPNGNRRKSTPRRAAEVGVQC